MLRDSDKIREAINTLHDAGYAVGSLWHEEDVLDNYDIPIRDAQGAMDEILHDHIETIWEGIGYYMERNGYEPKE